MGAALAKRGQARTVLESGRSRAETASLIPGANCGTRVTHVHSSQAGNPGRRVSTDPGIGLIPVFQSLPRCVQRAKGSRSARSQYPARALDCRGRHAAVRITWNPRSSATTDEDLSLIRWRWCPPWNNVSGGIAFQRGPRSPRAPCLVSISCAAVIRVDDLTRDRTLLGLRALPCRPTATSSGRPPCSRPRPRRDTRRGSQRSKRPHRARHASTDVDRTEIHRRGTTPERSRSARPLALSPSKNGAYRAEACTRHGDWSKASRLEPRSKRPERPFAWTEASHPEALDQPALALPHEVEVDRAPPRIASSPHPDLRAEPRAVCAGTGTATGEGHREDLGCQPTRHGPGETTLGRKPPRAREPTGSGYSRVRSTETPGGSTGLSLLARAASVAFACACPVMHRRPSSFHAHDHAYPDHPGRELRGSMWRRPRLHHGP